MQTEVYLASHPQAFAHALARLRAGQLVAFPTDTVYGIAAMAFDANAIESFFSVKGRDLSKAIPILLSHPCELPQVATNLSHIVQRLAKRFWPGPLTLVVVKNPALPPAISPDDTVGVRMPDHPLALQILRLAGPLAVTSANLSGNTNTCTAAQVMAQLGGLIPLIIDGGTTPGGIPSTVVDCTGASPTILRQGPIGQSDILAALEG